MCMSVEGNYFFIIYGGSKYHDSCLFGRARDYDDL